MKMRNLLSVGFTSLAAISLCHSASAAVFVSDSISYPSTSTLGDPANTGGTGWGATWRRNATTNSAATIQSSSLPAPSGYATAEGGSATLASPDTVAYRNLAASTGINLDANQDVYVSLLVRRAAGSSAAITLGAGSTAKATFGISGSGNLNVGTIGAPQSLSGGATLADTSYLLVVKLAASAAGNDQLFLSSYSTTIPTSEPTTWDVTGAPAVATGMITRFQIATGGTIEFDEIRIGTTYADVVPEPASLAAIAAAALALGGRRRR